ncbi:Deacetylase [Rubellimicrobium mesophilum DSM 19309]|uniref:Deacetylase n=1 Tax=Rubellimicrobium mesophilum DSM 19309 TaxID=442562 RepID=A0A017HKX1_9RHOB|nr:Deacetylase [Rubellimicrobium mesophilum DSM 19309]
MLGLRRHGARRVAYVDIDAHHCDGVEHAFRDDPEVLLVSTHEEGRWPRTGAITEWGAGNVFNLPVPRGFHDDDMARVREGVILPAVAAFRPDAIVMQSGSDGVLEDPQSRLALSNNAHAGVLEGLRPLAPRLMVLGGGGYNPWAVGRCWTRLWGALTRQEVPERLPAEAEAVLRGLRWQRRGGGSWVTPPEEWVTTLADPWRGGGPTEGVAERVEFLAARLRAWA